MNRQLLRSAMERVDIAPTPSGAVFAKFRGL
jgi:hypothetical protein